MKRFFAFLKNCRGATAIEFALIGLPAILLFIGLVEFGRGLHIRGALNDAADRAHRAVLVDPELSNAELEESVRSTFLGGNADELVVTHSATELDGLSYRRVAISFDMQLLLPTPAGQAITLSTDRLILTR